MVQKSSHPNAALITFLKTFYDYLAVESDDVIVMLEECLTVRNCEQSDSKLFGVIVEHGFDVHTDGTCAFILTNSVTNKALKSSYTKDCEVRLMVEQSSHGNSLFFSSYKDV